MLIRRLIARLRLPRTAGHCWKSRRQVSFALRGLRLSRQGLFHASYIIGTIFAQAWDQLCWFRLVHLYLLWCMLIFSSSFNLHDRTTSIYVHDSQHDVPSMRDHQNKSRLWGVPMICLQFWDFSRMTQNRWVWTILSSGWIWTQTVEFCFTSQSSAQLWSITISYDNVQVNREWIQSI